MHWAGGGVSLVHSVYLSVTVFEIFYFLLWKCISHHIYAVIAPGGVSVSVMRGFGARWSMRPGYTWIWRQVKYASRLYLDLAPGGVCVPVIPGFGAGWSMRPGCTWIWRRVEYASRLYVDLAPGGVCVPVISGFVSW
jgi:hypothetical protein